MPTCDRPVLRHPEIDAPRHWCLEFLWRHTQEEEAQKQQRQSLHCKPRAAAEGLLEGSPAGDAAPAADEKPRKKPRTKGHCRRLHEKGSDGECLIQQSSRPKSTMLGAFLPLPKLSRNLASRTAHKLTSTCRDVACRISTQKRSTSTG